MVWRYVRRVGRVRRWLIRLVARLHAWAESGWSGPATGTWGVLQGSVMPGPSEALLVPLGLADPRAAWRLATWALVGTVLGGLLAFGIGVLAFDTVGQRILGLAGVDGPRLERLHHLFDRRGALLIAVSALTPVSTKVISIAAGAFGVPLGEFAIALLLARGGRLYVVATLLRYAGVRVRDYLLRRLAPPDEEPAPEAARPRATGR